jgi:hypothetical protein
MTNLLNPLELQTQVYLVEKGVRLVAQVGCFCDLPKNQVGPLFQDVQVATEGYDRCLPFWFETDRSVVMGYARYRWAAELYQWAETNRKELPVSVYHAIIGLLHGYSGSAIRSFLERVGVLGGNNEEA